jgi:hypothetical protein
MTTGLRRWRWRVLVLALLCTGASWARDHHGGYGGHYGGHHHGGGHDGVRFGFYMGDPFYSVPYRYGFPYYGPYYSPPTVITVPQPAPPPVYIQQTPPVVQQALPAGYWYYCSNPEGYYPYVKQCPVGWQQVEQTPADAR